MSLPSTVSELFIYTVWTFNYVPDNTIKCRRKSDWAMVYCTYSSK